MKIKIFVIHYKKLIERKQHILEQFNKLNITDFEFITLDRDEIDLNHYYPYFSDNFIHHRANVAIVASHFMAFSKIANNENYDAGLIFEDDVFIDDDFNQKFENCLKQLPQSYDLLFLGNGCNFHIQKDKIKDDIYVYRKGVEPTHWGGNGITRCTDSYLVSKKCAINLCNYIENNVKNNHKINMNTDHWLNDVARFFNLEGYWAEPTFITQGTQNGAYQNSYINLF